MRLKSRILVPAAVLAVCATAALAAAPSMSTRWADMTLSSDDCVAKARRAVRAEGFTKNFEVVSTTVFGERGDYTCAVRCAADKEIVFFVVAGPVAKRSTDYNAAIAEHFD
jgi:hypothetical protein